MKQQIMSVVMLMAVSAAVFQAHAAAPTSAEQHTPGEINYQGKLVKTNGDPVADDTYTLDIRLYRVSSGGTAVWGGRYATYTKGGYFNLMLGGAAGTGVSPAPPYPHNELWRALWPDPAIDSDQKNTLFLGVTPVSGAGTELTWNVELTPRQNLLAAPYAFRAQTAEYANQSIENFTVNGAFSARYEPASPFAFRTYKSSGAPFVDIGGNGTGETKLRSATTRVTSDQLIVSSATQSFTSSGTGNITVNSGTGNVTIGGNNATIDMSGNVTIKGAGSLGTMIGSTSKPLAIMGNSVAGSGPLVWNRPTSSTAESPFLIRDYTCTVPAATSSGYFDLGVKSSEYSATVAAWSTASSSVTLHRIEPLFTDGSTAKWQLRISRYPVTSATTYKVSILFINKHMVDDQRTAWPGEG